MDTANFEKMNTNMNVFDDIEEDDDDGDDDMDGIWNQATIGDPPPPINSPKPGHLKIADQLHKRVIIHLDIDCFYAQVEMIRNPELRDKPIGIQQKNIIVTCNYKAREHGATKLMYITDAREKCPDLVLVSGEDLTHYREMSYKISEFLLKYCPKVERLGFDENFLDVTELITNRLARDGPCSQDVSGHLYRQLVPADICPCGCHQPLVIGSQLASEIREALFKELGITCCAGIAHNKLLSKLVAGCHKPNQQTTLFPQDVLTLLGQLSSVRNIPGIGHTTTRRLREMDVVSIQDLQNVELSALEREFGKSTAQTMKQLSVGEDGSPVVPFGLPQTLSDEDSFKKCCTEKEAWAKIRELINSLLTRLKDDGRIPQTLRLTVRKLSAGHKYPNRESRQCPIPSNIKFSAENTETCCTQLEQLAQSLFKRMVDTKQHFHLTLMNVAFTKLEDKAASENAITRFFSPKHQKTISDHLDCQDVMSPGTRDTSEVDRNVQKDSQINRSDNGTEIISIPEPEADLQTNSNTSTSNMPKESKETTPKGLMQWINKAVSVHTNNIQHIDNCLLSVRSEPVLPSESIKRKSTGFFSGVMKRVRTESTDLYVNKHELKLPEHIDKSVFEELPADIQDDILRNVSCTSPNSSNKPDNCTSLETLRTGSGEIVQYSTGESQLQKKHLEYGNMCSDNQSQSNSNRTSECMKGPPAVLYEEEGITTTTHSTSTVRTNEQIQTSSVVCDLPESLTNTDYSAFQKTCTSISKGETNLEIPPNVDKSVFLNLPADIQHELVMNWKSEKVKTQKKSQSSQPGILNFFVKSRNK